MKVRKGDKVKVHYTGTLDDGTVFDSSEDGDPLEFEVGSGQIVEGFEKGIMGMQEGEEKTFIVPPEEAYGPHRQELVGKLPKEQVEGFDVKVGSVLQLETKDGEVFEANVMKVEKDGITVDLNHPLAGKALNFKTKLVGLERS
ncbi:MAG: peptidylprolyl isomerase [Thermoplasmata archaeon]